MAAPNQEVSHAHEPNPVSTGPFDVRVLAAVGNRGQVRGGVAAARRPQAFACPRCRSSSAYAFRRGRQPYRECAGCGYQCSLIAGTMFEAASWCSPVGSWPGYPPYEVGDNSRPLAKRSPSPTTCGACSRAGSQHSGDHHCELAPLTRRSSRCCRSPCRRRSLLCERRVPTGLPGCRLPLAARQRSIESRPPRRRDSGAACRQRIAQVGRPTRGPGYKPKAKTFFGPVGPNRPNVPLPQ